MGGKIYREVFSCCKKLSDEGLVSGSGGNISVKEKDKLYITSAGSDFSKIDNKDICTLDLSGKRISEGGKEPSCEWRMHLECYKNRPDIRCVVHTHPIFTTIVGISSQKEVSVSYELVASLGISGITKVRYLPPGSKKLADEIGRKVTNFEGMILVGHGLLTVGNSIKEAIDRSVALERESKRWVYEKILRKLNLIDEDIFASLEYLIKI